MKSKVLPWLALLVLASSACAGDDVSDTRFVRVSGDAKVLAEPDKAVLSMGVEERDKELRVAQDRVNRTIKAFLKVCKDLDIEDEHIKTAQLITRPEYDWQNQNRQRRLTGYYVLRQLQVDVRDLDKLGELMENASDAGVNQIGGVQMASSKEKEYYRDALAKAADDARMNAEVLAKTLDAKLGEVRSIVTTHVGVQPPIRPMARAAMAEAKGGPDTYQSGEIQFIANVTVEFELR